MPDPQSPDDSHKLLTSLFHNRRQWYRRLAYGVLGSWESADEICQDAFVKALESNQTIRDWKAIDKWLTTTVLNGSLARLRHERVIEKSKPHVAALARPSDDPAKPLADRDLCLTALAQLPEETQRVVVLRKMQGLSGNEVAQTLNLRPAQVSIALHAGLNQMLEYMIASGHYTPPSMACDKKPPSQPMKELEKYDDELR